MSSNERCRVTAIACGSAHSVALLSNGMVLSWGRGEDGQLGHGRTQDSKAPRAVSSLFCIRIGEIKCGAEFSLAWSSDDRQLYGWGWADSGNLDSDIDGIQLQPLLMPSFSGCQLTSLACGDGHTAVVTSLGELYMLGSNQNGQLGLGHNRPCFTPQLVQFFRGIRVCRVACGAEHCAATTERGELYTWGCAVSCGAASSSQQSPPDGRSQILKDFQTRLSPMRVEGLQGVFAADVVCGWRHNMALSSNGECFTWGWNCYGQLGTGDTVDRQVATKLWHPQGKRWFIMSAGWRNSVAVDVTGQLFAWGWNKFGQLGLGHCTDCIVPNQVIALAGQQVRLISCGWRHTMAVTTNDDFYVWGRGSYGRLGLGEETDKLWPTRLEQLSGDNLRPARFLNVPINDARLHSIDLQLNAFAVPDSPNNGSTKDDDFAVPI
eukprot:TRINITY_DN1459_c0_g1_i1.p1 TRINITY_DN1459_c0_g1~~TRINITY_DN1459_c0_g1_i1.p1  ORF type:complete len:472 (-),score=19.34 TRINITY_DN1459_c0_g1_i1:2164-3465(-)